MKIKKMPKWKAQRILKSFPFLEVYTWEHHRVKGTDWIFYISTNWSAYWNPNCCNFCILDFSKDNSPEISFEGFFEKAPPDVRECLAFHLDLFR